MKYKTIHTFDPNGQTGNSLEEKSKDVILRDWLQYPNNSIEHKRIYEKLLDNIDKIPIDKLKSLIDS